VEYLTKKAVGKPTSFKDARNDRPTALIGV
jgi:hypothetical protein